MEDSGGTVLPSPLPGKATFMRPVTGHGLAAAAPGGNILPESHRKYQTEPSTGVLGMLKSDSGDGCTAPATALKNPLSCPLFNL